MRKRIVLPRITGFRLRGFDPVFSGEVTMTLGSGPYVILGGNGLGKTTLMQALVYGLAGGLTEDIEETKSHRWDHSYFRGRLNARRAGTASIEVDFAMENATFSVRRGFRGSEVTAFRKGSKKWIDGKDANAAFEKAIREHGGYQHIVDFAFIVHRLIYLPESRRLLAWDIDAQVRILMLLNQDVIDETEFRSERDRLRNMDSQKRHIHVQLGKVEDQLSQMPPTSSSVAVSTEMPHSHQDDVHGLVPQLRAVFREKQTIEKDIRVRHQELNAISADIDPLREEIERSEAALVESFLTDAERSTYLALHKLAENGICPACGTKQQELQAQAARNARDHRCMLCGSDKPASSNPELATLRSRLSEKLRSQESLQSACNTLLAKQEEVRRVEADILDRINEMRYSSPIPSLIERGTDNLTTQDLIQLKESLSRAEADLEVRINELHSAVTDRYQQYRLVIQQRLTHMRQQYQEYATSFLGLPCDLSEKEETNHVTLAYFVPHFNGVARDSADACSEAQRFFLDIAYRMALIAYASSAQPRSTTSSFLCETPETALDMSYIDNVVTMFQKFAKAGHSIILTANIQTDGLAEKLMRTLPITGRRNRVLSLLDVGQLSEVHKMAINDLKAAVATLLKGSRQTVG